MQYRYPGLLRYLGFNSLARYKLRIFSKSVEWCVGEKGSYVKTPQSSASTIEEIVARSSKSSLEPSARPDMSRFLSRA